MNCTLINQQIEQLSVNDVKTPLYAELDSHLQQCDSCMQRYQAHQAYLVKMQTLTTPELHPSTAANMLRKARQQGEQNKRVNNGFMQGFIAASILAVSVLGTMHLFNQTEDNTIVVKNNEATYIDENVTIVIHANSDLYNAELDLILPQQVAIAGFENIQQLTWPVDLKKGANTLELPIRVNMDKSLEQPLSIMATLYHEESVKDFEIDLELNTRS